MSRNQTAHKWKAPYRSLQLREVVFWRLQDLLNQSFLLHQQGHGLGARIILRSAFETLAMLIYGNQLMDQALIGSLNFHEFSTKTEVLLLGSRDGSTPFNSINILTVLTKCDNQYPGILAKYERLSESAHPNYEGAITTPTLTTRRTSSNSATCGRQGTVRHTSMRSCSVSKRSNTNTMTCGLRSLNSWRAGSKRTTLSLRPPRRGPLRRNRRGATLVRFACGRTEHRKCGRSALCPMRQGSSSR